MVFDIAVVGAGVVGALTARELSKYTSSIALIEKGADVASGSSKANSGICHAGYDAKEGSLKARFNVEGAAAMEEVCRELDVPFRRTGSLVAAFSPEDERELEILYRRGIKNGVSPLKMLSAEETRALEPALSPRVTASLYAPGAGILCPYELTVAAAEMAVLNGARLFLEFEVSAIRRVGDLFELYCGDGETIRARAVVNAAGIYSDRIASLAGAGEFGIIPRKGEYMLYDRNMGNTVNTVIFMPPSEKGKGVLVAPTVDGNLLIGPNSNIIEDREAAETTSSGLEEVLEAARRMVPTLSTREVITSFAGLRSTPTGGDFIIGESAAVPGFFNAAGIESPGLTASPAIARHIAELVRARLGLLPRKDYVRERPPVRRLRHMTPDQINAAVAEDPRYGRIVCRCEKVTEGEIVDAIRRPAGARNLDAVKRRTRAGMGRCQGGFCTPRVVEILSRELGIPVNLVTKKGRGSEMLDGSTK